MTVGVLAAAILTTATQAALNDTELPLLTSAAQVRALSAEEAERGYPVRIRGVVTYYEVNPDLLAVLCFAQDETGAVYVSPGIGLHGDTLDLTPGQFVEIEGFTTKGQFAPFVRGPREKTPATARVLGDAPFPSARPLRASQLANTANHCQFVAIGGIAARVTFREPPVPYADGQLVIEMLVEDQQLNAIIPVDRDHPDLRTRLEGTAIRVRGVYGSIFNEQRELIGMKLFIPNIEEVRVDEQTLRDLFAAPLRTADSLMQFHPDGADRVRVRGEVTLHEAGHAVYLHDGTGGARILSPISMRLLPGDLLEAVGYPAFGQGGTSLHNAVIRRLKRGAPKPPIAITAVEARTGLHRYDLVAIEGLLLDAYQRSNVAVLLLQSGDLLFQVRLTQENGAPGLDRLVRNSWVEAVGICIVQSEGPYGRHLSRQPASPASFQIMARSPADITVLRKPPWWTPERMAWVIGGTATLACLAFLWIALLRRQVAAQAKLIHARLQHEFLMEERARIARELHDSLEQELSGISIQLDSVKSDLDSSPTNAKHSLELARAMVRHSQSEAKRAVWDLRSLVLEEGDLPQAMRRLLTWGDKRTADVIQISVAGRVRNVPKSIAHDLLRIAQEATTNAIRHGNASQIVARIEYGERDLMLAITDNGSGFETESVQNSPLPCFGLRGMQEQRAICPRRPSENNCSPLFAAFMPDRHTCRNLWQRS